eukprot:SAG22_NODE_8_length_37215_cov_120.960351_12_plen_162_part_00
MLFLCLGRIAPGSGLANKAVIFVLAGLLGVSSKAPSSLVLSLESCLRQCLSLLSVCPQGGMAGVKVSLNTIAGDVFAMEDTATALSCSSISASLAAGSAFLLGPSASLAQKAALMLGFGGVDLFGATAGLLPALKRNAKKAEQEAAAKTAEEAAAQAAADA